MFGSSIEISRENWQLSRSESIVKYVVRNATTSMFQASLVSNQAHVENETVVAGRFDKNSCQESEPS